MSPLPVIALLGAGVFAKDQYVKVLRELTGSAVLSYVWSRSEKSARETLVLVAPFSKAEAVWGEEGLEKVLGDGAVDAVMIVLAAHVQPAIALRALKAGKHVLQEKPIGATFQQALEAYQSYSAEEPGQQKQEGTSPSTLPIWAVAENYRFEPALEEAALMVRSIGPISVVHVSIEAPMTAASPFFSTAWRRDAASFPGAFLVDGGVHFVSGLRLITGCEVTHVTAVTSHHCKELPGPDTLSALLEFGQPGFSGVLTIVYATTSRKVSWRVVGASGTVEVERGVEEGRHGYWAVLSAPGAEPKRVFHPFDGVQRGIASFISDVTQRLSNVGHSPDPRSSANQALQDIAIVDALLSSNSQRSNVKI